MGDGDIELLCYGCGMMERMSLFSNTANNMTVEMKAKLIDIGFTARKPTFYITKEIYLNIRDEGDGLLFSITHVKCGGTLYKSSDFTAIAMLLQGYLSQGEFECAKCKIHEATLQVQLANIRPSRNNGRSCSKCANYREIK